MVYVVIVLVLTFLAVVLGLVAGLGFYRDFTRPEESRARARLDQEFGQAAPEVLQPTCLFPDLNGFDLRALDPRAAEPTPADGAPTTGPARTWAERLTEILQGSALSVSPGQLLAAAMAGGVLCAVPALWFLGPLPAAGAFAAGAMSPFAYLRYRLAARRERFLGQLPDAFELMARVLRAGHSVPQSFQSVADSFAEPIAGEFRRCQEQQNLGLLPELAYQDLAERSGVLEMKIFAMAMTIQRQTGGNLSEVLERLASLIRERVRLRGQVRVLTAEGRLQAAVLLVLPLVLFVAMRFVNPKYAEMLLENKQLLWATAASMALGTLWIRKIIQLDA